MKNSIRPISLSVALLMPFLIARLSGGETAFEKTSYTYKQVDEIRIQADVYRADDEVIRPTLVYIHGGALINGSRAPVPRRLLNLAQQEGYVLVSIDYRLAPEVKLPAIIEDLKDAFTWIRAKGPTLFHANPEKLVVSGGSAGGYLALMSGICVEPRPTALVAYWGYGDVDGDWYTQPSAHYRQAVPLIAKEEAYGGVGGKVLSGVDFSASADRPGANSSVSGKIRRDRARYYRYLRQNGLWTREVTGFDPATQPQELDPYCPVRNVTSEYPPTILIHGTEDTDVPYALAVNMAAALAENKISHELVAVQGAGHGLSGGDPKEREKAHEQALDFVKRYLQ